MASDLQSREALLRDLEKSGLAASAEKAKREAAASSAPVEDGLDRVLRLLRDRDLAKRIAPTLAKASGHLCEFFELPKTGADACQSVRDGGTAASQEDYISETASVLTAAADYLDQHARTAQEPGEADA